MFKKYLLRLYKNSCAICGVSFEAALEAAHIVPDAKGGTYESQNGILLCATHHKLFESHIITIDDNYCINIQDTAKKTSYSDYDRLLVTNFHGKKIALPESVDYLPSRECLRRHREKNF